MATRADFTPDEWQTLATAPFITSLIVTVASPSGPIGVLKEAFAVSKSIVEASREPAQGTIVRELLADLKARKVKPEAPSVKTPEELRALSLDTARRVTELLQRAAPDEAPAITRWLYDTAERVARASKEGGVLGFGGVAVDEKETAALAELSAALGLTSGSPGVAPSMPNAPTLDAPRPTT